METITENPRTTGLKNPNQQPTPIPKPHKPHQFPSHLNTPNISPTTRTLCDLLTRTSPQEIESALTSSGINPSDNCVHEVLKLSYNYPFAAVKFFRWVGNLKKNHHSPYAWNLMVDILGKNNLFEPMWDAIRSMKQENVLSLSTFVSVFESYCTAGRFNEALMSFDVINKYSIKQDIVAVNSLISAICREDGQTSVALEFVHNIREKIAPDGDTFAILLEGWEKEGNVVKAKSTFGEMVVRLGWSQQYMLAYDAFLMTLFRAEQVDEGIKFLKVMKDHGCSPGLKFFTVALDMLIKRNDVANVVLFWDLMIGSGAVPNLIMYDALIGLLCNNNEIDHAFRLLDEMPLQGVFPESLTFNMIFECLVKNKKVRETERFFTEMVKNEWPPTPSNCAAAIAMLFDCDDPEAAHFIWSYAVENRIKPLDESANALLLGLCKLGRLTEVRRSAEDMLDRRINIYESTMMKLKDAFYKEGRSARDRYDSLSRRWKAHVKF